MIRVLIVDDQEMIRTGLRTIISSSPDLEVVGDVGDGFLALEYLDAHPVDVVLLDIRMPGIDGVETTARIRKTHAPERVKIIILTTFEQEENVYAALSAGANGFLGKGVGPVELIDGIIDVSAGGGTLSTAAAAAAISRLAETPVQRVDEPLARRFEALTARERDVVVEVTKGLSNDEIAAAMFVSPFTVKTHVNRAMAKVEARDRAQLVAFAYRAGIAPSS
ncbi:DNA-binding NarL/FixJ family response regulator [Microbacterium terrae]|uniref:Transcriptional regulatory protein LiaR n=1 Tax=Microbacterium terrae TaxID=69369 RepID=A0A0M2HIA0_9MICO|nr:response regulator transcription factor [Microbacterium terrae]KJL44515.1 Transcriptional regulatory protein LiaR [Microbacterium terrae]MBP1079482.1 DNA-binding NarL/FixJ family response regulator [Microbacterium terrae]GLJ96822.1 DNA-binding response regulator [Microbacterium terrae]